MHEIYKPLFAFVGVEPLYEVGVLGGYAPVALARLAAPAEMAAEREQRGGAYVAGVGAERHSLYHVGTGMDGAADDYRNAVAYALLAEPFVNLRKSELYGNTDVVAYSRGSGARTSAVAVYRNDIGAASCNARGDCGDVVHRGNLNYHGFGVCGSLFEAVYELP